MFEQVVVGVGEDTAGRDAIALAMELVAQRGELTLVHVHVVMDKPAPDSGSFADAAKRRQALHRLAALASEFSIDPYLSCVEAKSVRLGLHKCASDRRADLLVVCATGRDELERVFIGDDTREVLEDAPCAVAVAPAGYRGRAAAITRIGVAYDGSVESERALALARTMAAERDAELSAFEAVKAPMYAQDAWNVAGEAHEQVEEARRRVAALGGVEPHAEFCDDAVEGLTRYGASVDLLVLGSHRYRPMDRLRQGSTSQRLADAASSPLLVSSPSRRAASVRSQ